MLDALIFEAVTLMENHGDDLCRILSALVHASNGNAEVPYYVGVCYKVGKDAVLVDIEQATYWLNRAADALCILGIRYLTGDYSNGTVEESIRYLSLAAQNAGK